MKPLVTIITPCYRQAHFLGAAIESALAQTYPAIEILVINDGSDDDTELVAKKFGNHIRYHWQPNAGLPAARNTAISLARGKYIHCLDADDRLAPEAIEWLAEAADGREDVLCVMGVKSFERDDALGEGLEWMPPTDRPLAAELLSKNFGPPHMFLCPRSMLLEVGGFDESLASCEDWDLWLRLVFAGVKIVPVRRIGAFYRRHPASMSRNRLRMATFEAQLLRRSLRWIARYPAQFAAIGCDRRDLFTLIRQQLAERLFLKGYYLRNEGHYFEALGQYCDSIRSLGPNTLALSGVLKLAPHWVARRLYENRQTAT